MQEDDYVDKKLPKFKKARNCIGSVCVITAVNMSTIGLLPFAAAYFSSTPYTFTCLFCPL